MAKRSLFGLGTTAILAILVVGCADPTKEMQEPTAGVAKKIAEYKPTAMAGIDKDVTKSMDPNRMKGLIASTSMYGHRDNPFALSRDEIKFDELQASEKFLSEQGHFSNSFVLPEDKDDVVVSQEAQPYRRISGIVIGDAVYAILEENGRSSIIRPGDRIPDTAWTVASIDRDGVTLRRPGNVQPNEIYVRLETAPPGFGSGPTGGSSAPGAPGSGGPQPPRAGASGGPGAGAG